MLTGLQLDVQNLHLVDKALQRQRLSTPEWMLLPETAASLRVFFVELWGRDELPLLLGGYAFHSVGSVEGQRSVRPVAVLEAHRVLQRPTQHYRRPDQGLQPAVEEA